MNTFFKRVFFVVALATVIAPTIALAQKSAGGVTGDARLRPGTWNSQRTTQSRMRSESQYRSTTPSERAPQVVAQAPTERRSYSYEPSQSTDAGTKTPTQSGKCGCGNSVVTEKAQATTEQSTDRQRSYSYEPSMSEPSATPRSYAAPGMRSSNSSQWQRTSGTKAERNNQRN